MRKYEITFQIVQTFKTVATTPTEELAGFVNLSQRLVNGSAVLVEQTDPEILTINEVKD